MNVNEQLGEDNVAKKLLELKAYTPFLEQLISTLKKKQSSEGKLPNPNQLRNIETLYNIISTKEKKSQIGLNTLVKCEAVLLKISNKIEQTASFGTKQALSLKLESSLEKTGSSTQLEILENSRQSKIIECKKPLDMQFIPDIWQIKSHSYQNFQDSRLNDSFKQTSLARDCKPSTSISSTRWVDENLKKKDTTESRYERFNSKQRRYRRSKSKDSTRSKSREKNYNRSISRERSMCRTNRYNRSVSRNKNRRSRSNDAFFSRHDRSLSKDKSLRKSRRGSRGRSNRRSQSHDKISNDRSLSRSSRISRGRIYRRSRSIDKLSKDGSLPRSTGASRGRSYRRSRSVDVISKDRSLSRSRRVSRGRSYSRSRSIDKMSKDRSLSRSRRVSRGRSYRRSRSIERRSKDRSLSRSRRVSRGRSYRRSPSVHKRSVSRDSRYRRSKLRELSWDSSSSLGQSTFRSKRHRSKSFGTHRRQISKDIEYGRSKSREIIYNTLNRGKSKSRERSESSISRDKSKSSISQTRENSNERYLSRQSLVKKKKKRRLNSPKSNVLKPNLPETCNNNSSGPKPLLKSDEPDWDIDDNETELKCFQAFPLKLEPINSVEGMRSYKPILIISDSDSSEPPPTSSSKKKKSTFKQQKDKQAIENSLLYSDISDFEEAEGKINEKLGRSLLPIESSEWERKSLMKEKPLISTESRHKEQTKPDTNVLENKTNQKPKPLLLTDDEDWDIDETIENNNLSIGTSENKTVDSKNVKLNTKKILQPPPEVPQFIKHILDNFEAKKSDPPVSVFTRLGDKLDFAENFKINVKNDKLEISKPIFSQTSISPTAGMDSISSTSEFINKTAECCKDSEPAHKILNETEQTLPPSPDIIAPEMAPPPPQINFNLIHNNRLAYKYNPRPRRSSLAAENIQDNTSGISSAGSKGPNNLQNSFKLSDPRLKSLETNSNLIQIKTVNTAEDSTSVNKFETSTSSQINKKQLDIYAPKTYGEYRRRTEKEREHRALTNKINNASTRLHSSLKECKLSDNIQTKNVVSEEKNVSKKDMEESTQQNSTVTSIDKTFKKTTHKKNNKKDHHKKNHSSTNRKELFNPHSNSEIDKNKNGKNKMTSISADHKVKKQAEQTIEKSSRLDPLHRSTNCNEQSSTSVPSFKIPKKNQIEKETGFVEKQPKITQTVKSKPLQSTCMKSDKEVEKTSFQIKENLDRNKIIEDSSDKDINVINKLPKDTKDSVEPVSEHIKPVERIQRDPRLQFSKLIKEKQNYIVSNNLDKTGIIIKKLTSSSKSEAYPHENAPDNSKTLEPNVSQTTDEARESEVQLSESSDQKKIDTSVEATDLDSQLSTCHAKNIVQPIRKRRKSVFDFSTDKTEVSTQNIITGKRKTRAILKMSETAMTPSTSSSPISIIATDTKSLITEDSFASTSRIKPDVVTENSGIATINITEESRSISLFESFLTDNPSVNKMNMLGMLSKVLDEKKFVEVKKIIENDDIDGDEKIKEDNLLQSNSADKRKSCKYKTELDRLNEDVRDMFICKDILMATGKRNCTNINKVRAECTKSDDSIKSSIQNKMKPVLDNNHSTTVKLNSLRNVKVVLKRINLNDFYTNVRKKKVKRNEWARGNIKKKKKKIVPVSTGQLSPILSELSKHSPSKFLPIQEKKCRPCPKSKKCMGNLPLIDASSKALDTILKGKSFDCNLKNIHPEIHSKSPYAKHCVLCSYKGDQITNHYILNHIKSEIYTSRLPSSMVADLLKDKNNVPAYGFREKKRFCYLYQCPFCDLELTLNRKNWVAHFTTHTGEYLFKCTSCYMVANKRADLQGHKKLSCPKGEIVLNTYYGKNMKVVQGLLCTICNFVQMVQGNMVRHLKLQHGCRSNRYKILNLVNLDNVMKIKKGNDNNQSEKDDSSVDTDRSDFDKFKIKNKEDSSPTEEVNKPNNIQDSPATDTSMSKRKLLNNVQDSSSKKRIKISDKNIKENAFNICDDKTPNESNQIMNTLESFNKSDLLHVAEKNSTIVSESSTKFKSPNNIKSTKSSTIRQSDNSGILIINSCNKTGDDETAHPDHFITIDSNNYSSSSASLVIDESYESEKYSGTDAELQGKEKANSEDADDDEWEDIEILSPNTTAFANTSTKTAISKESFTPKDKKNKTILQKLSKLYAAMKPKSISPKIKKKVESSGKCPLTSEDANKNENSNLFDCSNPKTSEPAKILSISPEPLNDLNDISNLLESTDLDSMELDENICETIDVLGLRNELEDIVDLTETRGPLQNITDTEEIIETIEHRINNVGFRVLQNKTVKYVCLVPNCTFLYTEQLYGIQCHFVLDHPNLKWNGFCYYCEKKVNLSENQLTFVTELNHMEENHVKNLKSNLSNETEDIIKPRITVRRLSGDLLSTVNSNTIGDIVQEPYLTNMEEHINTTKTNVINEIPKSCKTISIPRFPNLIVKKINQNGSSLKKMLEIVSKPLSVSLLKPTQVSIIPSENTSNENNDGETNTTNLDSSSQLHEGKQNIQNKSTISNGLQIVSVSSGISFKKINSVTPAEKAVKAASSSPLVTGLPKPKFTIISKSKLVAQATKDKNVIVVPSLHISNVVSLSNEVDSTINNAIVTCSSTSVNSVSPSNTEGVKTNFLRIENVCSLNEKPESINLQNNTRENNSRQILKPWCNFSLPKPLEISKLQLRPISLFALYKCMSSNCFFTTENENALINHFAVHTCSRSEKPNDWLECSYCDFHASNNQEYFSHITKKHQYDIFQCPFCFYRSCNDFCVSKHLRLYHPNNKNKVIYVVMGERKKLTEDIKMLAQNRNKYVKNIQCYDCGKVFYIMQNFLNHITAIHKLRKFACSLCLQFIDIWDGPTHYLKKHLISNYQCIYCTFTSLTRETIVEHLTNKHPSNLMYACYRISPMKNMPVAFETIENSTVLENMNAVVLSSCLKKCTFISDELNFMSPSLDPKSIQNNKNGTISILNKTKYLMNLDIAGSDWEDIQETFKPPTNIKIISVKSLSEIQNELNFPITDSTSKQHPDNVNTSTSCEVAASQIILPSVCENSNKIEENNSLSKNISTMDKILEAADYIVSETGFEGSALYICPYCTTKKIVCLNEAEYNLHLTSFHLRNQTFKCPHCNFKSGHIKNLCTHLLTHRKHRYLCYYCNYSALFKSNLEKHALEEHSKNYKSLQEVSIGEEHIELSQCYKILCPKGITKQEILSYGKRLLMIAERKKPLNKKSFHSTELNLLPHHPIFNQEVLCAECNYGTKVRTNMVRHLTMHINNEENNVPSSDPVNPVPCRNTNDKQFDIMINLASSSNENKEANTRITDETNSEKTVEIEESNEINDTLQRINAKIPVFVEKSKLFVCGTSNCKYIAQYDYMLKCHLQTLHLDEEEYICPHCTKTMSKNINNIDKIMEHYKFHDSTIYVCNECTYMHYEKCLVESHIKEKHPNQTIDLLTYQRTDVSANSSATSETDAQIVKTQQTLEKNSNVNNNDNSMKLQCALCKYYTETYNKMNHHLHTKHGVAFRYTCSYCKFGAGLYNLVSDHVIKKHPEMNIEIKCAFYAINSTINLSKPSQTNASSSDHNDSCLVNNIGEILTEKQNEISNKVQTAGSEEAISSKQMECNELHQENSKKTVCVLDNNIEKKVASNSSDGTVLNLDIYACFYCSFKNISFKAVQHHWSIHHNNKNNIRQPFRFQIFGYMSNEAVECPRPDISSEHLQRVLRFGHKTKRYQCNKCWKLFADGESVIEHQKVVHSNSNKVQTLLFCFQTFHVCNICEYASLLEHKTAAHLLNHYESMKKCHLCDELYESIIDFIRHLSKHDITLLEFLAMDDKIMDFWNEMYVLYSNGFCAKKKNLIKSAKNITRECLQKTVLEFSKLLATNNLVKSIISNDTEKELVNNGSSTSFAKANSIKRRIQFSDGHKKPKKRSKKTDKDFDWLPSVAKYKELSSSSSSENEDNSESELENNKIPYKLPARRKSMYSEVPLKQQFSTRRRASLYYENPRTENDCLLEEIKVQKRKPVPKCMQHLSREQLIPYSFYGKKPKEMDLSRLFIQSPENNETTITVEMFSILNPINIYVSVEKLNPELISNIKHVNN